MSEQQTVYLQGVGKTKAKPAEEFRPGERMMWNWGTVSEVYNIMKETPCFITFAIVSVEDGAMYERRMKKGRLVAIG